MSDSKIIDMSDCPCCGCQGCCTPVFSFRGSGCGNLTDNVPAPTPACPTYDMHVIATKGMIGTLCWWSVICDDICCGDGEFSFYLEQNPDKTYKLTVLWSYPSAPPCIPGSCTYTRFSKVFDNITPKGSCPPDSWSGNIVSDDGLSTATVSFRCAA